MSSIFEQRPTASGRSDTLDLQRIFLLRNIMLTTVITIILITHFSIGLKLPLKSLTTVLLFLAVINFLTYLRLRKSPQVTVLEFFAQLALDVIVLTALFYFTGGSTNPFVSLFLLPLVIVGAILPSVYAWVMAALSVSCYTLLMFFYVPLPHNNNGRFTNIDLHTFGMWFSFLIGVGLIVFVVVKMASSLRERDLMLVQTREKLLRDEHLISLGTLATGAAHELGTPLATMAVLTKEIERNHAYSPALVEKIRLLRSQVDRCKDTLAVLSDRAGQAKAESGGSYAIDQYLDNILMQWRSMRPRASVSHHWNGSRPAPRIVADKSLSQAFINILNNAADASIDQVEVAGHWSTDQLVFEVRDRGKGYSPIIRNNAGKPFITTKADGLGLGLFLVQAIVSRFDGEVKLLDRRNGGACTRIELPLSKLLASPA